MEKGVKTKTIDLFYPGYDGANFYRIPSLVTAPDGTLITSIDKNNYVLEDFGDIDAAVRRSFDNGKTFEESRVIIDMPSRDKSVPDGSAYVIDSCMLVDEEIGRVYLLIDMFPESNLERGQSGSGFTEVDGTHYLSLYDDSNKAFTIRAGGRVYDEHTREYTAYTADEFTGALSENGKDVGNIYLKNSPLRVLKTSYLYLIYSDDNGKTWSRPRNINYMVKKDDVRMLAAGPGRGIQLKQGKYKGRLIFPVYLNNTDLFYSCAAIYSDDHGESWKIGGTMNDRRRFGDKIIDKYEEMDKREADGVEPQVIEMPDGAVKMFIRNFSGYVRIATSVDGGESWLEDVEIDEALPAPYCQMTVMRYPKKVDGKELVLFANPADAENRVNGTVRIGEICADNSIRWTASKVLEPGDYGYSCLTVMKDGSIGIVYEAGDYKKDHAIKFTSFNLEWIKE